MTLVLIGMSETLVSCAYKNHDYLGDAYELRMAGGLEVKSRCQGDAASDGKTGFLRLTYMHRT
jgi:hypothetical protein